MQVWSTATGSAWLRLFQQVINAKGSLTFYTGILNAEWVCSVKTWKVKEFFCAIILDTLCLMVFDDLDEDQITIMTHLFRKQWNSRRFTCFFLPPYVQFQPGNNTNLKNIYFNYCWINKLSFAISLKNEEFEYLISWIVKINQLRSFSSNSKFLSHSYILHLLMSKEWTTIHQKSL